MEKEWGDLLKGTVVLSKTAWPIVRSSNSNVARSRSFPVSLRSRIAFFFRRTYTIMSKYKERKGERPTGE
jgi:hypothetical protein